MKVLFVSKTFPHDLRTQVHGVYQRLSMFTDAIGRFAELEMLFYVARDVDVSPAAAASAERSLSTHWKVPIRVSLCRADHGGEQLSKWERYGKPALSFFQHPGHVEVSGPGQIGALEACLDSKPDAIFAYELGAMCPLLLTRRPLPPVFFDLNDIAHVALYRGIGQLADWRDRLVQYSRLPSTCWGERRAVRLAAKTYVCSETDRKYLAERWRFRNVVTIPNTVTATRLLPVGSRPTLLFVGSYRYRPNVQAAEFLLRDVWPRIVRAMPSARLIIAGAAPENIAGFHTAGDSVEFSGFVSDLEELYRRARVVCAPILSGSGTRVKIIEAAAYGKPIVATTVGAEGLLLRDGTEVVIRDDASSFADACLTLLNVPDLCVRLGRAAHAVAEQHYRRENVVRLIQSSFMEGCDFSQSREPISVVANA